MRYSCFILWMILPIWPPNGSLCATCLDSEPLHFALKSVEIMHA